MKYMVSLKEKTGERQKELHLALGSRLEDAVNLLNSRYDLSLPSAPVMIVLNGKGWRQYPTSLLRSSMTGTRSSCFHPFPVVSFAVRRCAG